MDIYMDPTTYDVALDGKDLRMTTPDEDVASRIKAFLQLNVGGWFLNTARGLPFTDSMIEPNVDVDKVGMMLRSALKALDGVEEVNEINLDIDTRTAVLSGSIVVNQNIIVEV